MTRKCSPAAKRAIDSVTRERRNGVDPKVVARIFREFEAGKTVDEVVRALNTEGSLAPNAFGRITIAHNRPTEDSGSDLAATLPRPESRVAIYSRCATSEDSVVAIEAQQRVCRKYADSHGWIVASYFSDANRSGRMSIGREGLAQLLAAASRGEFEAILVDEVHRISRSTSELLRLIDEINCHKVTVVSITGGVLRGVRHLIDLHMLAKGKR